MVCHSAPTARTANEEELVAATPAWTKRIGELAAGDSRLREEMGELMADEKSRRR